jgi:hypothetical protein
MQLAELFPLARDSVGDPRGTFRRLLALQLGPEALWPAFFAVAAISVILLELTVRADAALNGESYAASPFATAGLLVVTMLLLALGVHWGGRLLGGRGDFSGAMLLVVWLQFVLGCLQAVQLVALVALPFLAGLIGLAGLALSFWLLTGFVAELHGFRSRPRVFAGILIGLLGFSMLLMLIMALLGLPLSVLLHV